MDTTTPPTTPEPTPAPTPEPPTTEAEPTWSQVLRSELQALPGRIAELFSQTEIPTAAPEPEPEPEAIPDPELELEEPAQPPLTRRQQRTRRLW